MDADGAGIEHRWSGYLDTYVQVGVAGGRVVSVTFTDEPTPESEEVEKDGTDALEAVFEYLDAETRATPDVPYALTVSGVEKRARKNARYSLRNDFDVRRVRGFARRGRRERVRDALHANPVPIVLPSHRVVAEDGVGGFAGPRRVKRLLLKLED